MPNPKRPFHDEPRSAIIKRRLVTIPRSLLLAVVVTVLLPVLLVGALAVDVVRGLVRRKPFVSVRIVLAVWVYSLVDVIALTRMFVAWLRSGFGANNDRLMQLTWPIQAWWGHILLKTISTIFGLKLDIRGLECVNPSPVIAMFRHASIIDNLLPAALIQYQHKHELRWLIKRELLSIAVLDAGGTRLPNHFVDRNSADPRSELRAIKKLATDLTGKQGILIYPEGTRFTPKKQARALQSLQERSPAIYERAKGLTRTMPPRPGGALTLLDSGHDVVVCAHEGFGGFATIGDIWSGGLVGKTITIELWRIPAAEIPTDRQGKTDWLFETWQRVDDWIVEIEELRAQTAK